MNKPIVCYLYTSFDKIESFNNFIINYKKFPSGLKHKLVICFKLLNEDKINHLLKIIKNIDFITYIDPIKKNDYDFGSYKRVAEVYPENQILFLNSHSYPICHDWLLKLINNSGENTLIGTSASNESILDSLKLKKNYKFFSYLFKKIIFKRRFNNFPNPHIRTSSFLIKGQIFLNYMSNRKINNKIDAWTIESGKDSLTNYFKNNNYFNYVVNSDGEKFTEENWKSSEIYNYFKQSKSIISDKHTRKYESLNENDKLISRRRVWGE